MTMDISEDLSKFKLLITDANEQCRKLILDESQQLSKLLQDVTFTDSIY